jgi:hypothetical protein
MSDSEKARSSGGAWPYAIAGSLILFAAAMVGFAVWTGFLPRDLVAPDYYARELRHDAQMAREVAGRAADTGLALDPAGARLSVRIAPAAGGRSPQGRVDFYRPSDARLDFSVPLALDDNGAQVIDASAVPRGLWRVRLIWTTGGPERFIEQEVFIPRDPPAS